MSSYHTGKPHLGANHAQQDTRTTMDTPGSRPLWFITISGQSRHLLVIIDEHSRYPVIEICGSTSSEAVILLLDKLFALMGVAEVLQTDNGPPWNRFRMAEFPKHLGFKHWKVTPCWPQNNSEAERFMRVINKCHR